MVIMWVVNGIPLRCGNFSLPQTPSAGAMIFTYVQLWKYSRTYCDESKISCQSAVCLSEFDPSARQQIEVL